MKTKIKIIAMLMSMIIGTLAASAQSTQRGNSEQKRTPSASKTYRSPEQNSQNPGNAQRREAEHTTQRDQTQNNAIAQRQGTQKTSTTTLYNPRSDYRQPNKSVSSGSTYRDPKYNDKHSSTQDEHKGHNTLQNAHHVNKVYTHYYYPTKKVKIHVHPMTYQGNYRALYYPSYSEIIWTRTMHRHYASLYPSYTSWHYGIGYRIQTISVFDAGFNLGEVSRVYGRVYATWYNQDTDDLLLFFGGEYPHQAFTMVVPGNVARRYSWRPERYFLGQHVAATGLITQFEGKAEMIIKRSSQLDVY